jgi:hypothetical protein
MQYVEQQKVAKVGGIVCSIKKDNVAMGTKVFDLLLTQKNVVNLTIDILILPVQRARKCFHFKGSLFSDLEVFNVSLHHILHRNTTGDASWEPCLLPGISPICRLWISQSALGASMGGRGCSSIECSSSTVQVCISIHKKSIIAYLLLPPALENLEYLPPFHHHHMNLHLPEIPPNPLHVRHKGLMIERKIHIGDESGLPTQASRQSCLARLKASLSSAHVFLLGLRTDSGTQSLKEENLRNRKVLFKSHNLVPLLRKGKLSQRDFI